MQSFGSGFLLKQVRNISSKSPFARRALTVFCDFSFVLLSIWAAFSMGPTRLDSSTLQVYIWLFPCASIIAISVYFTTGQYKSLTRFTNSRLLYKIAFRNSLSILLICFLGLIFNLSLPALNTWILFWFFLTSFTILLRILLRDFVYVSNNSVRNDLTRVIIYGAGNAGAQLAFSLLRSGAYSILFFVDDDHNLWGMDINGIKIFPPSSLKEHVNKVDQLLMAIPSASRVKRRSIVLQVEELGIPLLQIPSIENITSGKYKIDYLQSIIIEDLLGRDSVPPDPKLLGPGIRGKSLCVTGAGGSIGSQLCREIIRFNPSKLILIESNEPSLYSVYEELKELMSSDIEVIPLLGNCLDQAFIDNAINKNNVNILFHAAAYKHVPLVQSNPIQGIKNNVFSTITVCRSAYKYNIEKLILVSTDKAVRPTNIMGASKRLSELVVQSFSKRIDSSDDNNSVQKTLFSMVRFGNVLGSSGSVVPLFKRQIAQGGPITLTHPDVIRYFMTIQEAAQLVLQSSVLAKGGDVFLLDMGEPVLISELARQMIRLSGLSIKDSSNKEGDIEIITVGLRPGEKLYEELLIDKNSEPTSHPLIFRGIERSISSADLWPQINALEESLITQDDKRVLKNLSKLVPEWKNND